MPVQVVEVQPLDAAKSQALLCSVCPELNPTVAKQLAEQCGNIPIALKVVASTVQLQLTTAEVILRYADITRFTFPLFLVSVIAIHAELGPRQAGPISCQ